MTLYGHQALERAGRYMQWALRETRAASLLWTGNPEPRRFPGAEPSRRRTRASGPLAPLSAHFDHILTVFDFRRGMQISGNVSHERHDAAACHESR